MFVPLRYNWRSLFVRKTSTLLTVLGIAATVTTVGGVLALQQGFSRLYADNGRDDVGVFLRPGATSEGLSMFSRELAQKIVKTTPAIATTDAQQPLASMECFLAVRLFKKGGGGETNVSIRGVQPSTFELRGDRFRIVEGERFTPGNDEIIVGRRLVDRIENCAIGDVLQINTTPLRVVGVFECEGPFESEIWGDFERLKSALQLFGPNRVVAQLKPGTDVAALNAALETSKETPAEVQTERDYLASQTEILSSVLVFLGTFLGLVMGIAAVFTATNTMLAAVANRTHEIGILLSNGFRPLPIFLSFLLEAAVLGLLGGALGCLFLLPLNGIETGTTNFATFTEVAFGFRITPRVLLTAVLFSVALGLVGGAWPAWRASRLKPAVALRRL